VSRGEEGDGLNEECTSGSGGEGRERRFLGRGGE